MARLIGGPLDGATIGMEDTELTFTYVEVEAIDTPDGVTRVDVRHTYKRTLPCDDLTWSPDA